MKSQAGCGASRLECKLQRHPETGTKQASRPAPPEAEWRVKEG